MGDARTLVWGFAHAILLSKTPVQENCTSLAKTIRYGGDGALLKVKAYLPSTFSRIRAASGVVEQEFDEEWEPDLVAQNFAFKGNGKSGAHFVMSKTRQYLLKTLRKEEKDALVSMASDLAKHFEDYPGSLLSRQYMLCRIQLQGAKNYFVVFNNLFSNPNMMPALKYDLKGARINRKSKPELLSDPSHVRMDLDEPRTFGIHSRIRDEVLQQIRLDSDLLAAHNIMDYSLLVGVVSKDAEPTEIPKEGSKKRKKKKKKKEEVVEATQEHKEDDLEFSRVWRTGIPSAENPNEHYLFGIIDILQDYNTFKKAAHALKVVIFWTSSGLSTVDAHYYSTRFKDYMEHNVISEASET